MSGTKILGDKIMAPSTAGDKMIGDKINGLKIIGWDTKLGIITNGIVTIGTPIKKKFNYNLKN